MMRHWAINVGLSLMAVCILMTASLYSRGEAMPLSGTLIYSEQNSIYALELSTLKTHMVYEEQEGLPMFLQITKIDDKRVLIEDHANGLIKELDLGTKTAKAVRYGYAPKYISEHRKLFFYKSDPDKVLRGLYVAELNDRLNSKKMVRAGQSVIQVVQVSKDEILFRQDKKLWLYNILTEELQGISIKNCSYPKIMRKATGQLLCFDAKAQHYFLTDLKGEHIEDVPALGNEIAVLYIPKYDALIFGKTRFQFFPKMGEVEDIWVYDFRNKKVSRLLKHVIIGVGTAVWLEDKGSLLLN